MTSAGAQTSQPQRIPVYRGAHFQGHMSIEEAHRLGAAMVRTKHRFIVRALLPPVTCGRIVAAWCINLSRRGYAVQQELASGRVWALRGVRGT